MRAIIFRHLPDEGYESAFETLNKSQQVIPPEMVIPGFGKANSIYIRHTNFWHRGETILLITKTYEEPTGEDIEIVRGEAIKMLDERN